MSDWSDSLRICDNSTAVAWPFFADYPDVPIDQNFTFGMESLLPSQEGSYFLFEYYKKSQPTNKKSINIKTGQFIVLSYQNVINDLNFDVFDETE